ncbi:hypothetical protein EG68_00148 [Paragonimus skrjabini miyazakii]|uniref:Cadherin domain-containing protein n=1 Tax=Paragonimus skrjabini miyazakii TaxID=59628 RepID=A0A8S9ZA82_9TREM|nr:hypothetical protein EG68_00148 [Paragonimus skrjabini miyazakii]
MQPTASTIRPNAWTSVTSNSFSVNLTQLFLDQLHLEQHELLDKMYFADVEQSKPFLIRRQQSLSTDADHSLTPVWYQLTTLQPLDREIVCNARHYPERLEVAQSCCPFTTDQPTDVTLTISNYPCCVFLGITVANKGTHFLRIDIIDVNDHSPRFTSIQNFEPNHILKHELTDRFVIGIMENTAAGAWIHLPVAVDEDEALNGAIRYSIKMDDESKNWTKYFRLLNNLKTSVPISHVKPISRTTENGYYHVNLSTTDYNGPGLLLLQPLDRETISDFTMTLVATDLGQPTQRSGMILLQISVLDENDNPPVFEKSDYYVEVNENEAGITFLYGCANDSDAGNNGRVTYHMQPSTSANAVSLEFLRTHIQLIPASNSVAMRISQPLDFEKQPQFDFALLAIDQGRPALSATANIHVTVRNVNDQAPVIRFYLHGEPLDKDYARLIISEHLMVNGTHVQEQLLCHVHVVDNDSNMSDVDCNVESVERKFMLREVSMNHLVQKKKIYELLSVIHLDRETVARHLIIVRCQDGLLPNRLVSHKQLQLLLSDVNDNDPLFDQDHYHGYVYENAANAIVSLNTFDSKPQQTVVKNALHATDRDAGQNALIHYLIIPWTGSEQLRGSIRGNIPQNHTDYGTVSKTKGDKAGGPMNGTNVEVQRNNSYPHFKRDFEKFYVDSTNGQIRTRIALDCEQQRLYRFTVQAVDQSVLPETRRTATTQIRDENDNPPVMEQRHYSFKISEALPRHSRVGQINSTDADISPENRLTVYAIRDIVNANASEFLFIEAHTGVIRTRKVIDREQIQQISFVVVAQNEKSKFASNTNEATIGGIRNNNVFYDEASVNVEITDENDNTPLMLARGQDPQLATGDVSPAVVDLTFKRTAEENTSPCVEFPFYFADADDGANGAIDVVLETNPYFEFRLDNTLLCRINANSLPLGQINLFVVLQDRPIDISKTLKRRYTIRVHVVQERVTESAATLVRSNQENIRHELSRSRHLLKSFVDKPMEKHFESEDPIKRSQWRLKNAPDKLISNGKLITEGTSHANTSVTIVAILVTVSGVLCLLLLSVVFVLRRIAIQDDRQRQARQPKGLKNQDQTVSAANYPDGAEVCYLTHKAFNRNQPGEADRSSTLTTQDYCPLQPIVSQVGSNVPLENESYRTLFIPHSFAYSDQCTENCISKVASISSGARTLLNYNKLCVPDPTDQNDFGLARDITLQSQRTPIPIVKSGHKTSGLSDNLEKSTKGIKLISGNLLNICPVNERYNDIHVTSDEGNGFTEKNITFLSDNKSKPKTIDSNTSSALISKNKTKFLVNRTALNNKRLLNDPTSYTVENVNMMKCSDEHPGTRRQEKNYPTNRLDPVKSESPHTRTHTSFV